VIQLGRREDAVVLGDPEHATGEALARHGDVVLEVDDSPSACRSSPSCTARTPCRRDASAPGRARRLAPPARCRASTTRRPRARRTAPLRRRAPSGASRRAPDRIRRRGHTSPRRSAARLSARSSGLTGIGTAPIRIAPRTRPGTHSCHPGRAGRAPRDRRRAPAGGARTD
jgi:hypothetical protein